MCQGAANALPVLKIILRLAYCRTLRSGHEMLRSWQNGSPEVIASQYARAQHLGVSLPRGHCHSILHPPTFLPSTLYPLEHC